LFFLLRGSYHRGIKVRLGQDEAGQGQAINASHLVIVQEMKVL
jgi:hypothetical protein